MPATAQNVSAGDDFLAASTTGLLGLVGMFDNAGGRFTSGPRWAWASGVEAGLVAYQRTGGALFPNVFVATFELNRAGNFIDDLGYDDEGWWGNAWVRAYDVTGEQQYLDAAKLVFNDMTSAWDTTTCGGGMWWNRQSHYKNAITAELFFLLAANLQRRLPGDATYPAWTDKIYGWWKASSLVSSAGLVVDGLTAACKSNGQTPWTYNQGVILGALVEMYEATSDPQYLDAAKKLADASTTKLVTPAGILVESCEPAKCDNNQTSFKGLYQRYLARLADVTGEPKYQAFLATNARSIWKNAQLAGKLGLSWSGPFDLADAPRQASALHALEALMPESSAFSLFVRAAGGLAFNHELGFPTAPRGWGCGANSCPAPGVMQGGPFLASVPLGAHVAQFRVSMNDAAPQMAPDAPIVTLEVYDSASQMVVASRDLAPSAFTTACVAQTFGVPFVQTAALGPLELRVRWLATSNAPEVVVSDVSIDGQESYAAASLEHDCGRLDRAEELVSDRHHEQDSCVLGRAPGAALAAGPQRAWFELGIDDLWSKDEAVAELSVVTAGSAGAADAAVVATRTVQRSDFKDGLLHAFNVDFTAAAASARYDFVVKRLAPTDAPRLRLRAIYARRVVSEQPLTLPFDTRAVGNAAADGDADGSGTAFAAEALTSFAWPSATFKLGPLTQPGSNALSSAGQALPLSAPSASALHVLLLAAGGAQPDNVFTVDYAQGAPQTFTRSLSDWLSPELLPDENLAVRAPFVWTKTAKSYGAWHVVELTLPLDPTRAPAQLTLPKNAHLKILAITLTE